MIADSYEENLKLRIKATKIIELFEDLYKQGYLTFEYNIQDNCDKGLECNETCINWSQELKDCIFNK